MSFLENDPLKIFLGLELIWVGLITAVIGLPAFWVIDFVSAVVFKDKRIHPGWGTWLRWYSNWIGDLFCLTGAVVFTAWFYQESQPNQVHLFAGGKFWIATAVIGSLVPIVFVALEEIVWKSYQGWADKWRNPNRWYHSAYMAFMAYILFAGLLRAGGFWTYRGGELQAIGGMLFFLGWVGTEILDNKVQPNFKSREIEPRYPGRMARR